MHGLKIIIIIEKIIKNTVKSSKNNKDYFRKYSREYIRNRRERDKDFRLKDKISTQVYQYCAGMNLSKTNSFFFGLYAIASDSGESTRT